MPKRAKNIFTESRTVLKKRLRSEKNTTFRLRLQAAILLFDEPDLTRIEISERLGVGIRTLERWFLRYQTGGLNQFLSVDAKKPKQGKIDAKVHAALEEKLRDSKRPLLGYWQATQWVKENHGVEIKYHTLRAYMKRNFKCKLKVARKSHVNKDKEAEATFLKLA